MSIGDKYGRLTITSEPRRLYSRMVVDCLCECGKRKTVNPWYLKKGLVQSCGCLKKEWNEKVKQMSNGASNL